MANVQTTNDGSIERVLKIKRCAAVVKGGRRFSFAALVVVGDGKGRVGYGYGKANEVPPSVQKAQKQANREVMDVPHRRGHYPPRGHRTLRCGQGHFAASQPRYWYYRWPSRAGRVRSGSD